MDYSGFIVGGKGIRPQPQKLLAVREWPIPKSVTDIRSFLGLCGFYERFVKDYSSIAAPLTNLQQTNVDWHWDTPEQNAFEELKKRLLQAPVLIHPDMSKPFVLHSDASDVGIGAVLSQLNEDVHTCLIACHSKNLNQAERN